MSTRIRGHIITRVLTPMLRPMYIRTMATEVTTASIVIAVSVIVMTAAIGIEETEMTTTVNVGMIANTGDGKRPTHLS